ncbi:hypothetical protein [Ruegeria arenilitoris]|uniref:MotE family protein n=1 Tax=Ruegeria arenilitoris TaxID=1173585 RepID=UPI001480917A
MKRSTPRKSPQRQRGGVLTVISLLMIGSATLRLGLEAGPALARGTEPDEVHAAPVEPDLSSPDLQMLLTDLLRREERLKERENAVLEKERALEVAEEAIETRLTALQQAENSLRETLAIAEQASENDLTQLTDVYQNMKPKDAAALFETMDPVFAAGFLSRMPTKAAAGVMAGLNPEIAYTISVVMAGRNASVPQE